ncbi:class I SAM-dependent methyltransferase [Georgenia alba]|uniref:Methyltransferase domain-containing protein n=1 Tax=Georgenia alba TaxID=2233858 RepID=A0ABW2Q8T1_9MICO
MPTLFATTRLLAVHLPGRDVPDGTLDVNLDGHRVWSTPVRWAAGPMIAVAWPRALRPYLRGRTHLTVTDSATGEVIAEQDVRFPGNGRVDVSDARGRKLAVNKWDRLGPTLDSGDSGVQDRLLDSAVALVEQLQGWGYPVYAVGGTLLGAKRNGQLMPHDDDIDLAWLCDETTMADVSLASYEMERRLTQAGHTVVRHSLAHLQVTYFDEAGFTDHYIDIFTGFHTEDGQYNQPFALRGELPRETLVPTSTIEIGGRTLPAPARPEAWLEFAYGPSWLVPDPSFKFVTPPSTLRLFETTFGVYNRQRVWWEKHYEQLAEREPSSGADDGVGDVSRFLQMLPAGAPVIELGCGDGRLTERIAAAGHPVRAFDYSHEALRLARQTRPENVTYDYLNTNDRHGVLRLALDLLEEGQDVWFFASRMLHDVPPNGRESIYVLLRAVLGERTKAYMTFYSDPHPHRDSQNPETWHLPLKTLFTETRRFGLSFHALGSTDVSTPYGRRTRQTVVLWR